MQASQVESSRLDMLRGTVGDVRSGKNDDRRAKLDTLSTKKVSRGSTSSKKDQRKRVRERKPPRIPCKRSRGKE